MLSYLFAFCNISRIFELPLSVAAPGSEGEKTSVPAQAAALPDLTAAIATITSAAKAYSADKLPPTPPTVNKWRPLRSPDAPHDPDAYWPMALYGGNSQ